MNIVLVGYRASGKSLVGQELARRLGWACVDMDALIEQRRGKTIREIMAQEGEEAFRRLEADLAVETGRLDQHVISTGGGIVLREANVVELKRNGVFVWLRAPAEVLWERILGDEHRLRTRPPVDLAAGLQQMRDALALRHPMYARAADMIVDTPGRSPTDIVESVLAQIHLRTHP